MARRFNDIFGTEASEDLLGLKNGDDRIFGYGGNDRLYARGGNDELYGGAGNDLLDGMTGWDVMFGGSGDDLYRVDHLADVVSEETVAGVDDGGIDTVQSSITYTLGALLEKLQLSGTAAIDGTGNHLANRIIGNAAANNLSGQGGADTISGGAGDDTLIGGAGKDSLTGDAGSDTFVFGQADATSTDKVTDFTAEDWVGIYAADYGLSEGTGLVDDGTGKLVLDASYFVTVSGTSKQGTASGHGQFVYNTTTRALMWDADGAGTSSGVALATFNLGVVLSAANFAIITAPPTVALANGAPDPPMEGFTARIGFAVTLSTAANEDVVLTYSTVDGTAAAGSDFVGVSGGQVTIAAGSTSTTIWIDLLNDNVAEYAESFTLQLDAAQLATSGTPLDITNTTGTGNIADDETEHSIVAVHDMAAIGSSDPSGLTYVPGSVPGSGTLFLSDSEVEESPFFRPTNLFALQPDGTFIESFDLVPSFTDEPTGLAFNPVTGYMYISDDDQHKIFWVDPANPTVKLGEFATQPIGGSDPEDVAVDPNTGNVFIINGTPARTIVEATSTGEFVSSITLPDVITDPDALAYDATNDMFYVGGEFSWNVWIIDRSGTVVEVIDILSEFSLPVVHIKDLEIAPTSNPNDDPASLSLYVADYGNSHVNDGRLFEIDLADPVPVAVASIGPTDFLLS